jgi:signal peptidase I
MSVDSATHAGKPQPTLVPSEIVAGENTLLLAGQALLSIIVVAIFIITFTVQPFRIPSASMVPTLLVGDFLLVDKQTADRDLTPLAPGKIHRGDVIVFHFPANPSLHLVKRVVGLPGERLRMHNDQVFINGKSLQEPYAVYRPSLPDSFRDNFPRLTATDPEVDAQWWMQLRHLEDHGELRIPPNNFFVLGDNRNNSEDSRYWGLVPAGTIIGKPLLVYLSLRDVDSDDRDSRADRSAGQPGVLANLRSLARWHRALHIVR